MDLSFQEKSAWGLLAGLVLVSIFYFPAALAVVETTGAALPLIVLLVAGTVGLVIIEVVYHIVISAWSPKDADKADERDRLIDLKAERNGGLVLGLALFSLIGWILLRSVFEAQPLPLAIAVYIMLAITVAEVAKLASQIWYYRTGA